MAFFPSRRVTRLLGGFVVLPLLATLAWASWEAPNLHDYAPPTQLTMLRVGGLTEPAQAIALDQRLRTLDGVTACNVSAATQLAVVSHNPEQLSADEVRRALACGGAYAVAPPPRTPARAGAARPQCPVPASYLAALDRVRFTLNVRRFFVRGV